MLLRHTLLYLPAQVVGPLAQVAAAIVWTHWLAPVPYGWLTLIFASQDLMFLLFLSWWTQYTLRYLGSLDGGAREAFARSEASVLALASTAQIFATVLVFALAHREISADTVGAAALYVASRSLLTHLGERARAQSRIGIYTLGQVVGSVAGFAAAYLAVSLVAPTPAAILLGFAAAQAVAAAVMWRRLRVGGDLLLPRRHALGVAFAYGAPILVAGGAAWLAQNSIRLEVERIAGSEALGLVTVGWAVGQRLSGALAMLVVAASFPLAVQTLNAGSRADSYNQLSIGGTLLMSLIIPATVGLCFLAQPFVATFVAAPFQATTVAVLPYAAATGALRNIRTHVADPVFLLIERPGIATAINIVDAACVALGCLVGLLAAGLVGAVVGCLIGTVLGFAVGLALARRVAGYAFPFRESAKVVAASAVMGLVLFETPWSSLALNPTARMGVETLVGALVYVVALAAVFPAALRVMRQRLLAAYRVGTGVPLR